MAAHIRTRTAVDPPGLREPHVSIEGVVVACLRFAATGKVTDIQIISGPAMAQQAVLDSVKNWIFRPIRRNGHRYGGFGILRIRYILHDGQMKTTVEE
jgi:hypothetical protein